MRKFITIIIILLAFVSCGKLEDLNKNTKAPSVVAGESLFTNAQKNLFDQMVSANVNYNIFRLIAQYWTETTYLDESNYDLVTRTIPDNHWDVLYRDVLKNFDEAKKVIKTETILTADDSIIMSNKLAIIEVMTVYTYTVLVETFGNIPYSEALDDSKPLPKYDDGLTIYTDLISRLNSAINNMNTSSTSFGAADNIYQGDMTLWFKFANSLKLRMGLLLADISDASVQTIVKTAVESSAPNVFSSITDNASITYLSAQPNTNPVYVDLVASGRHDFVASNTFIDTLNSLNDPRRVFYFTMVDTSADGSGKLAYVGGPNGLSSPYPLYSHPSDAIQAPTFPGTIFDYPEVEFLMAEAVERGFTVGGTAEEHYDNAVKASIMEWGLTDTKMSLTVIDSLTNAYLANPKVAYTTATGDYKQKIGMQKWIALYNRGFEAWTEWRRFDFPKLEAPPKAKSAIPVRYTYPIEEQTLNPENYKTASAAIGGDAVTTKLFWDKF